MLTLPIKKKWFEMILLGEKQEEYREIKPYYTVRFRQFVTLNPSVPDEIILNMLRKAAENGGIPYSGVILKNGYRAGSPAILAKGRIMVRTGRPEWGAVEGEEYFVLTIDEIELLSSPALPPQYRFR